MPAPHTGRLRAVAVVLAGGTGSRVGLTLPKQLVKVAGRTVLEHTVEALHACQEIDEILVVMAPEFVPDAERLLHGYAKVGRVLAGGVDRNASTRVALDALGATDCNVLIHDAVRPLLSQRIVRDCIAALAEHAAVDVAIPSADTIIAVDSTDTVVGIPERTRLRRGQTPQAFRLSTIRRAYELAASDPDFHATDDCGVVLRYLPEVPIHVVPGDEQNLKITYPIDLFLADRLFQLATHSIESRPSERTRAALAGRTVVVFGGSSGIGADVTRLCAQAGARVFAFSRSTTGTYVERPETVAAALAQASAKTGRIDAVVLTAAQLTTGPLLDLDDHQVRAQVAVNYYGPLAVARASAPYLLRSRGHLVLFTSSAYTRGRADYALYSSAKAAVVNLAQALADEWSADGVHVNVVNPERTRTPMRARAFGAEPAGSLLDSTTVADTVLAVLASDLTGQVIDVRRDLAAVPDAAGGGEAERVAAAVADAEAEASGA